MKLNNPVILPLLLFCGFTRLAAAQTVEVMPSPAIVKSEWIFEQAPFAQCHASTIEETPDGLVAAWFGGTAEKNPDVGIWLSRYENGAWSAPRQVADGRLSETKTLPCWNPVLFQPRAIDSATQGLQSAPLMLFYKVGASPRKWKGMLKTSTDSGRTWSQATPLPDGFIGPVKNKPIQLPDGTILCPSSDEGLTGTTRKTFKWTTHFEMTRDGGATWTKTGPLYGLYDTDESFAAIQPTVLRYSPGKMQVLTRTQQGVIAQAYSRDEGRTWSALSSLGLPNPSSGVDAVMLRDGRALLVYNHARRNRNHLNVAFSRDGRVWQSAVELENQPGEYSYPAVIQSADGLVHITYTWKRERIKHVVIDPEKMVALAQPFQVD